MKAADRHHPRPPPGDELFDPAAVEGGAWAPGPYGAGDQLGTYREVDQGRLAAAVGLLDASQPLRTFDLGRRLYPGFPAYGSRRYEAHLAVEGADPDESYDAEVIRRRPRGPHRMTSLEERVTMTFNMGSKVNGLAHAGVGDMMYSGHRLSAVLAASNVGVLDTPGWGPPLVARGLLVDILGLKEEVGDRAALAPTASGSTTLDDSYRITLEDVHEAIERQSLPAIRPGDVVLVRTGWSQLINDEPERFLSGSPGVWLRESRWLGALKPALVATDSWMWGTADRTATAGAAGACHQELLVRFGVRIGEGFDLEELAAAGVDRFLFCHNPFRADGAVSSNAPATAIANVTRRETDR